MEIKAILKLIKKHSILVLVLALIGLIVGIGVFFIPAKYLAIGSFYINREPDNNVGFFTYEGYYSQQAALTYTNTVSALLESVDVQSRSLERLGIEINEQSLRYYGKNIKVKKSGPQLITLTVKGNNPEQAKNLWQAVSKELLITADSINTRGDTKLKIAVVSEEPVIKSTYKNVWVNVAAGMLSGIMLGIWFATLKEYD